MSKAAKSDDAPKKKGKLPLILGLVVLLAGGGGGGYWWFAKQKAVAAAEAEDGGHGKAKSKAKKSDHAADSHDEEEVPEGGALLPLDVFTVNLADTETQRFLRTNVQLVIDADEAALKHIEEEKLPVARARSVVLDLLSSKTSAEIATAEGKAALKKEIAEKATRAVHHEVLDVLFSDFVIQY
jgi:flagellar FliL protein